MRKFFKILLSIAGIALLIAAVFLGVVSMSEPIVLEDTVRIKASPERIWGFFDNIEENYISWDPAEHIGFRWIKGDSLEEGTVGFFDETIGGQRVASRVVYTKVVPYEEIEFKMTNLLKRIFYPRSTFEIKQDGEYCDFTAKIFIRMGPLANSENVKVGLEKARQHMREEDENLKELIE